MKVIGWTYYDSKEFVTNEALQNDEEHIACLVKEIQDKGYFFSGEDHINNLYCAPVFEDYTCGRYSEEAFSGIMALAHDEEDPNKYLKFESIDEIDRRLPPSDYFEQRLKDTYEVKVHEDTYEALKKNFEKFDFVYLPIPLDSLHLWLGDHLYVGANKKYLGFDVERILSLRNPRDIDHLIPSLHNKTEKVFLELERVKEEYKNTPFLLLGLSPSTANEEIAALGKSFKALEKIPNLKILSLNFPDLFAEIYVNEKVTLIAQASYDVDEDCRYIIVGGKLGSVRGEIDPLKERIADINAGLKYIQLEIKEEGQKEDGWPMYLHIRRTQDTSVSNLCDLFNKGCVEASSNVIAVLFEEFHLF